MTFKEYYKHYLTLHENKWNRRLHACGQMATILFVLLVIFHKIWLLLLAAPFVIYPFAWSGHYFFEKNKPAAFSRPIWAKACDWIMLKDMITGRIKNFCLICGSYDNKIVYKYADIPEHKRRHQEKDIVKCQDCGLVYCIPRNFSETMLDIYEENYWHEYAKSVKEAPILERVEEFMNISDERMSYIKKIKNSGSLLDVGCSMGFLVYSAKQLGYDASGIDLCEKDLTEGSKKFDINLKKSLLKDVDKYDYDIITSYNVIEHLSNPKSALINMRRRIKSDGIIVIGTHDIESKTHKVQKENWKHIIPTEHMYYFSVYTLNKLCDSVNLELIYAYKPIDNGFVSFYRKKNEQ